MGLVQKLKESFISGLVMIIPLLITILIVKFLAGWAFLVINPIVRSTDLTAYTANIEIVAQLIAGLFVVVVLTTLGYISNYKLSGRVRGILLRVVKDIPLFGTIYTTINQISSSFTGGKSKFKKLVLVEFPKDGFYSIGLITSESPDNVEEKAGKDLQTVFIPLSPNPTMGNLVMIEESNYEELDMSIQKGMKLLLTTGMGYEEDELPKEIRDSRNQENP